MKKLTLSLVVTGLAAAALSAYAAVPTGAAPFQVVVPNLKNGLEFTLQGLYLQPGNSDLNYATTNTPSPAGTVYNTHAVKPNYNFGLGLGLGYVFASSGNDIQVNWSHFDHNSGEAINLVTIPTTEYTHVASSNVSFKYNAVDLDMGQYLSMGSRLQTRLFAGLRFAQVKNDMADAYVYTSPANDSNTYVETLNSKFSGIGPRLGLDSSYHVSNCFGVLAHFATALLVGKVSANTNSMETKVVSGQTSISTESITTDKNTRVVPAFDAKLGVNYTVPLSNDSSRMNIEVGYQLTQYLDAIDRTLPVFAGGNAISSIKIVSSNVSFNGPYLSLNLKM